MKPRGLLYTDEVEPMDKTDGLKILQPGAIVQLNPTYTRNLAFAACLMIVTEIKTWGVQGFVQALDETRAAVGGQAYYRAHWDEIEDTGGQAVWIPK